MASNEQERSQLVLPHEPHGGTDLKHDVLDALEDNVSVLDPQGRIVAVNESWRSFARANGGSPRCVTGVGLNYLDICAVAQGDVDEVARITACAVGIRGVLQGRLERFQAEYACHSSNEQRWFRVRVTRLRNKSGAVIVHQNITKQVESDSALRQVTQSRLALAAELQAIVDGLPAMIGYWDKALQNRFANTAYSLWFGKTPDQIRGRHIRTLLGDKLYAANLPYIQGALCGEQQFFERDIPAPEGTIRSSQVVYTPHLVKGEVVGFFVLVSDVTQMKRTEQSLREAKEVAERAVRAKGLFLANISHELRTPMNGIMGMANLALRTELSAEQHEYLTAIHESATTLLVLLNDLLDFEKIEAGQLQVECVKFPLRSLVDGAVTALAPAAYGKGIELAVRIAPEVPDLLHGDPARLRQVLTNLLGNAIKFTTVGEVSVNLVTESIARKDGWRLLHITVRDTGIGIAKEQQERIFQPFAQGDESVTRRFGGTGLGLSICTRLTGLMGGKVWVEGGLGRGSLFHATCEVMVDASQQESPKASGPLLGAPVLVVDGHATSCSNLCELLSTWEMKPTGVHDLGTAQDALMKAGQPFALAVLRAKAPEPEGVAMVEELRRTARFQGAVVLLVPAGSVTALSDRCQALGIRSIVHKPIGEARLLAALQSAVEGNRAVLRARPQTLRTQNSRKVLLVEDNPINRHIAMVVLEKRGHRVVVVGTGREAVERLATESFDVVLMDLQMPDMGGMEATRLIRQREAVTGGHVRIAAVTAHAMPSDRDSCLEAGMDGYLTKPLDVPALYAFVEA